MGHRRKVQLEAMLHREDVDVCCLQESNLGPDAETPKFAGYSVLRQDRWFGRDGNPAGGTRGFGGVLTLIREGTQFERLPTPVAVDDLSSDVLAARVHPPKPFQSVTVVNVYRPPVRAAADDARPDRFDPRLLPSGPRVLVVGDVNAHHPTWDRQKPGDALGDELDAWAQSARMVCINSGEATRVDHATADPSTPDVTFVSARLASRCEWRLLEDISSDHSPILTMCRLGHPVSDNHPARTRWCEKKADWPRYAELIRQGLGRVEQCSTPLQALREFQSLLLKARDQCVPRSRRRDPKPWWSDEAARACSKARAAKRRWRRSPEREELKQELRQAEREAARTVRDAKAASFQDVISQMDLRSDPGGPFRLLKSMETPSGQPKDAALTDQGRTAFRPRQKADLAMAFYARANRVIRSKGPDKQVRLDARFPACPPTCCYCRPFTWNEMCSGLRQQSGRSAGPDDISPAMVARLPEEGKKLLLGIFNDLWSSGVVPSQWRRAIIVPLLKSRKDPSDIASYRPVSLTSCIGKLYERLVEARLKYWAETSEAIDQSQAGFRTGRSTEEQTARIAQYAMDGLQQQPMQRSLAVLVDFSQAFDRVWKRGLLAKMVRAGVPSCLCRWTRSFLADRRARVRWGEVLGGERILKEGLPQGCVVSPLLWLLFVNDITDALRQAVPELQVSLYADDLALCVRGSNPARLTERMQTALDAVERWAERWSVVVNVSKTESVLISTHPRECAGKYQPQLTIAGEPVRCNPEPVFLGVTFDPTLTFTAHARRVCERVARRTGLLRRLRGTSWAARQDLLLLVYKAYVLPTTLYGASTWASFAAPTTKQKVQARLNEALRIALGCPPGTNNAALWSEAGEMDLDTHGRLLAATLRERALRLPDMVPLREVLQQSVKRRLKARRPGGVSARRVRRTSPTDSPPSSTGTPPTAGSPTPPTPSPATPLVQPPQTSGPPQQKPLSCNASRLPTAAKCTACRLKRRGMRCERLTGTTPPPSQPTARPSDQGSTVRERVVSCRTRRLPTSERCQPCRRRRAGDVCIHIAAARAAATARAATPLPSPPTQSSTPSRTTTTTTTSTTTTTTTTVTASTGSTPDGPSSAFLRPTTPVAQPELRGTFRDVAEQFAVAAGLPPTLNVEPLLITAPSPPWNYRVRTQFHMEHAVQTPRTASPEYRRAVALNALQQLPPADIVVWTDGSAEGGTRDGGAGVVLHWGESRRAWSRPAGRHTSSFRAECVALHSALTELSSLLVGADDVQRVRLCTDSLSALCALAAGPSAQRLKICADIWGALERCARPTRTFDFVWVPGHCDISGNEEADEQARLGGGSARRSQDAQPIDLPVARAALRRHAASLRRQRYQRSLGPDHHHRQATNGNPLPRFARTPAEERALRLFRVDRHPACRATLARWGRRNSDGTRIDPECPTCGRPDNAAHVLLDCVVHTAPRLRHLGPVPTLDVLQQDPRSVLAFLRGAGLLAGPRMAPPAP